MSGSKIKLGYKALLADAEKRIQSVTPAQAMALGADPSVLIVDLRDIREIEREGRIPGSFHAPRGMLEFWIDPESPYFKPVFGEARKFIFQCASGWRSMLAADIAQRMGLSPVFNLSGGFSAWKEAGGPVEPVAPKEKKS
ncbi:MAG: rhodanese-like domain-containing protein [Aestuariivirgaceae bacterium]|nr:rhodanese-like domain-containing protein [Aestuariivirgaceae bacterium]